MKKIFKIIGVLLGTILLGSTVFAAGINTSIGAQQYMTKTGVNIVPIVTTYEFGSTTRRWAKGWFTDLDVSGIFTFGGVMATNLHIPDDLYGTYGNTAAAPDARLGWNTAQAFNALFLGISGSRNIVIADSANAGFNFAHGNSTDSTLFLHSRNQSTTQWLGLTHNATDGIISTGAGDLLLTLAGGNLAPSANGGASLGISAGNTFANLYLASGGVIDFGGGDVVITNASNQLSIGGALIHNINQANGTTGLPTAFTVNGGTHTGITAATEDIGVNFNFSATKTWAAGAGPLANQREILIQAPTYAGNAGGALTIADAYTLYVNGGPTQGANMTLTRSWAAGFLGNVGFAAGTETLPSIAFNLDPDTGIFNGAANTLNFTTAGGQRIGLSATAATFVVPIWSSDALATSLTLQNQTFTPGAIHNAVSISPTWVAENFGHNALSITATQNGANSTLVTGLQVQGVKATGGTTLTSLRAIDVLASLVTGTVTNNTGIYIASQTGGSSNWGLYSNSNNLTWNFGASNQWFLPAPAHTLANVINLDFDVNSASVNGIGIDGEVSTALSAGEIVNGVYIDIEGLAGDDATAIINGIAITSTNATGGASRGLSILGAWDTAIRTAGGSIGFNLDASNFVNIDARAVDHTAATVLNMTVDVNSASVNAMNVDTDVPTALSAAETVNGLAIDVDGNAADDATSSINGLRLTSANTTAGASTAVSIGGTWDTSISTSATSGNIIFNLGAANFISIDAETIDHTATQAIALSMDVNSVSANAINIDVDVPTALSAAEIVNGIAIDVDGNAGDNATSQINGLAITSVGTTGGANTGLRMNGYWDTGVLISRSVNFTGVDTETSFDINIVPSFTLTEPAGGLYTLFGTNIDLSGISVTAGAGTSTLAALRLVANADADVGTNYALFVDSGTSRFDGNIQMDIGAGTSQLTIDGSTGGCIMLRDTDDAGFTEVDALDGVLTASIDADGICD